LNYTLSEHAEIACRDRGIKLEWIERAMTSPALIDADRDDSTLRHAQVPHLVTVYFDRTMKGKL